MKGQVIALALIFFMAGCTEPKSADQGVVAKGGGAETSLRESDACDCNTADCTVTEILSKDWGPGPVEDSGTQEFRLPMDADGIRVEGFNTDFVQALWAFQIKNETGAEIFHFKVTAPITAVGENNNVPAEDVVSRSGNHTLTWQIEGVLTEFKLQISGYTCEGT